MAENDGDIELDDLNREREKQANEEDETNFDDDKPGNKSTLVFDGSNPNFTRVDDDDDEPSTSEIPNARRDAGNMRRAIAFDKKRLLKEKLGITINKRDGPNSTLIYDKLWFTPDKSGKKINGATYKGTKILVLRGG